MSRAFILGAGFSRQAGMPLATELTSLILDRPWLRDHKEMQAWVANLKQRLATVEGQGPHDFALNVEQLFDFAAYDEELWRMKQQLVRVGRHNGQTPWGQAESISAWLGFMEKELAHVIWDAQQRAHLDPIKRLTDRLSAYDKVITFNYDTLVERALSEQNKPWNHGLDDQGKGGTTVLKMHGSIDWILLDRRKDREPNKFVKLFSKEDLEVSELGRKPPDEAEYLWELWRAKDVSTCNPVIKALEVGLSNSPGLTGLGRYKPLHRLPGSAKTWFSAFQALEQATEIYVIGFSMSPYDTMTRFHFSGVLRDRKKALLKTVIIDPNAIALAPSFHRVFGDPLVLIPRPAEEINWEQAIG